MPDHRTIEHETQYLIYQVARAAPTALLGHLLFLDESVRPISRKTPAVFSQTVTQRPVEIIEVSQKCLVPNKSWLTVVSRRLSCFRKNGFCGMTNPPDQSPESTNGEPKGLPFSVSGRLKRFFRRVDTAGELLEGRAYSEYFIQTISNRVSGVEVIGINPGESQGSNRTDVNLL